MTQDAQYDCHVEQTIIARQLTAVLQPVILSRFVNFASETYTIRVQLRQHMEDQVYRKVLSPWLTGQNWQTSGYWHVSRVLFDKERLIVKLDWWTVFSNYAAKVTSKIGDVGKQAQANKNKMLTGIILILCSSM